MRGDAMQRCFEIIKMFESGTVTVRQIADRFDIHRHCAQRWIDQMSRFYPVAEVGLDYSNGGRPGVVYKLLKEA